MFLVRARLIAFYLPQFHPIPENDQWWGKGFTEWTNVAKAKPLYRGHYQPRVPADLGFYDLRAPETRAAQAELARDYGIEAFCYWHYWFNGKRLLEKPFNEVHRSGAPDLPFCLAWANETWSRRWLGEERDLLQPQTYSPDDDLAHARWLIEAFADPRHLRVNGRPLFLIYRPRDLPNANKTTDIVRNESIRLGLSEPFLLGIDAHCPGTDCRPLGFDGTLVFEPQLGALPAFMDDRARLSKLMRNASLGVLSPTLKLYDYSGARILMSRRKRRFPVYRSIFVGWDNTPRRGRHAIIVVNSTPEAFEAGLEELVTAVSPKPMEERLVFVNAWNEWAEGNYLEPDLDSGTHHLEAVRRVVQARSQDA